MKAPDQVAELVARFKQHRDTYRSGRYNEAQLREEFLNPFFEALGWDIYNRQGWSEAHREVIHEAAIKVAGRTKARDYYFRAGVGQASFFVEAKKMPAHSSARTTKLYDRRNDRLRLDDMKSVGIRCLEGFGLRVKCGVFFLRKDAKTRPLNALSV